MNGVLNESVVDTAQPHQGILCLSPTEEAQMANPSLDPSVDVDKCSEMSTVAFLF